MSLTCNKCNSTCCFATLPLFSHLDNQELDKVGSIICHKSIKKGQPLFEEGTLLDCLYIVNQGSMKVLTLTKEGREQILYLLLQGDFIGDQQLFKETIATTRAVALEDTHLCFIHKEDFHKLLQDYPLIQGKILGYAYERIHGLEQLVDTLTTKDIETRIATLLKSFIDTSSNTSNTITLPLNKEEMANYIGVTRETLSRKLSSLQKQGIIKLKGNRRVTILDLEALEDL